MSTQLVVSAAFAVVGFYVGGPTGAQVGWALGAAISAPTTEIEGARLEDLRMSGTDYGQPIPFIKGHPRIAGQVIWCTDKREVATTVSGKGGGTETTTYSYEVDCMIMLSDNELQGISRIWSNGELIYSVGPLASAASLSASIANKSWRRLTFYDGNVNQLPDPTMEAAVDALEGAGSTPAYRGRSCVFIEGFNLGPSGIFKNLTFEVYESGVDIGLRRLTMNLATGKTYDSPNKPVIVDVFDTIHVTDLDTELLYVHTLSDGAFDSITYRGEGEGFPGPQLGSSVKSYPVGVLGGNPIRSQYHNAPGKTVDSPSPASLVVAWNGEPTGPLLGRCAILDLLPAGRYFVGMAIAPDKQHAIIFTSNNNGNVTGTGQWHLVYWEDGVTSPTLLDQGDVIGTTISFQTFGAGPCCDFNNGRVCCALEDDLLHVWIARGDSYKGVHIWEINSTTKEMSLTQSLETTEGIGPSGDDSPSFTYVSIWAEGGVGHVISHNNYFAFAREAVDPEGSTVQSAVYDLCVRAGMQPTQFDVSDLGSITKPLRSLAISQTSSTRNMIESLATAYYFDAHLDDKLRFVRRGLDPVADIDFSEMAAASDAGSFPEPFPMQYGNELELPATVSVSYLNVDADYQIATEMSDRVDTGMSSAQVYQIAIGMNSNEAKGVADSILLDSAAAITSLKISVGEEKTAIIPSDVVNVINRDGVTYRMRVVRRSDGDGVITLELVLDDPSALIEEGAGGTYEGGGSDISLPVSTVFEPLDIPILRDADNSSGWYVAARGSDTPWPGAEILQSKTSATEGFETAARTSTASVIGTTNSALAAWDGRHIMDTKSIVTVQVKGGLSSATRDSLLTDGKLNAALIGDEIIRFQTVDAVSDGIYTLSNLLRAQRGTESFASGHASGERFVLLNEAALRRVSTSAADISALRWLKGVTTGRDISTATNKEFTDTGRGLKPLSPVDGRLVRDATTGGYRLTWSRRTRMQTAYGGAAGVVAPLGETSESYEADLINSTGDVISTLRSATTSVAVDALTVAFPLAQAVIDARTVGAQHIGIKQTPYNDRPGSILRLHPTDYTVTHTATLAGQARQLASDGTNAYVATIDGGGTSYVTKYSGTSLTSGGAYAAPASADAQGLAYDGSALWVSCFYSNEIKKVATSTMTYASVSVSAPSPGRLFWDGSFLWAISGENILKINTSTGTVASTFPLGFRALDVVASGSVVYVAGESFIRSLNSSSGATISTESAACSFNGSESHLSVVGGVVYGVDRLTSLLVFKADGTIEARLPVVDIYSVCGSSAAGLLFISKYVTEPGTFVNGFAMSAGLGEAVGARIYQMSSVVGRGYAHEVTFE